MRHTLALLSVVFVDAASAATTDVDVPSNPANGGTFSGPFNPLAGSQFTLSCICMIFGLIILFGQFLLLRKIPTITADEIIRNTTITAVIIGAIVLIVAGYDSQQTAQAFGLFGTIVGYLLGRSSRNTVTGAG